MDIFKSKMKSKLFRLAFRGPVCKWVGVGDHDLAFRLQCSLALTPPIGKESFFLIGFIELFIVSLNLNSIFLQHIHFIPLNYLYNLLHIFMYFILLY